MHYFDNAATTFPKPESVYIQMDDFYRNYGVNVGRGQFKEASIAHKMVDDTKELLLNLFHCNSANKQVIFTSSATEALNLVLRGIELHSGDVVYTRGGQGMYDGSSWSRGQAWALYGFALSYIHTGDIKYLNTAKRVAHYFISFLF